MSASSSAVLFHLDHPTQWDDLPALISIRGWAFGKDGQPIKAVRIRLNDHAFAGSIGYHRPDVPEAFPDAPHDQCGFREVTFSLDVQTAQGSWSELVSHRIQPSRWRWPVALGSGDPVDILAGQLALVPQHTPRAITPELFPPAFAHVTLPRLSIVTPNLNQGPWLAQCILGSAVDGQENGVEHHVRDGGSTDNSMEILKQFDDQLATWSSETDDGQTDAILNGFETTSGSPDDLMAWINADDFHLPGAVDFVRAFFAANPNVDVIYGNRVLVDDTGREVGRWHLPPTIPRF